MARTLRIVITGGGTGGHFYPLIAVCEALKKKIETEGGQIDLRFFSTEPYRKDMLDALSISFVKIPSGKRRTYFSFRNYVDAGVIFIGCIVAFFKLLVHYPDVVFSKGGYASFPTVFAARLLRIPVILHESDTVPGRVNIWTGKFASRVALSYPDAAEFFPPSKTAVTGQPIRAKLFEKGDVGEASRFFSIDTGNSVPVVAIFGGSQGAQRINDVILDILPALLERYEIIHQTGEKNLKEVTDRAELVLQKSDYARRYHVYPFFSEEMLAKVSSIAHAVVSRAGSMVFEFAAWGVPAVLVPLPEDISRDQTKNAFAYARAGCGSVLEEKNMTPHIFLATLDQLIKDETVRKGMIEAAPAFVKRDAAEKIADEVLHVARYHE